MGQSIGKAPVWLPVLTLAVLTAIGFLFSVTGCGSAGPPLDPPDSIVVYFGGVESRYAEGDCEYDAAFDSLKDTGLDTALETAVDPEMETTLKEGDCIEFVYGSPRRISVESQNGSVVREYDRLLFCFTGSIAGEVLLGLDGRYLSGTYRMGTTTWPY